MVLNAGDGFTCPRCDGRCRLIVETRADDVDPRQERVLRRRQCDECGFGLPTVEVPADRSRARIPNVGARLAQLRRSREAVAG